MDWIEIIFEVSPDGGSGLLEAAIMFGFLVVAVVAVGLRVATLTTDRHSRRSREGGRYPAVAERPEAIEYSAAGASRTMSARSVALQRSESSFSSGFCDRMKDEMIGRPRL